VYLFSGTEDRVGQNLEGVFLLIHRKRSAGIQSVSRDFCCGGRHEMLSEVDCDELRSKLLQWIRGVVAHQPSLPRSECH
jgi:hypothetical protein